MTTCGRCKREIDADKAAWSVTRRKHYCLAPDWPECDRLWFAELAAAQAEKDAA